MSGAKTRRGADPQEPIVPAKASPGIPQLIQLYAAYAEQLRLHALYTSPPTGPSAPGLSTNVRFK
ncbi:MAG: hypothetical protein ACLQBL_23660 [Polyangiaceae bacterium]